LLRVFRDADCLRVLGLALAVLEELLGVLKGADELSVRGWLKRYDVLPSVRRW
jgi:hypothetical protein